MSETLQHRTPGEILRHQAFLERENALAILGGELEEIKRATYYKELSSDTSGSTATVIQQARRAQIDILFEGLCILSRSENANLTIAIDGDEELDDILPDNDSALFEEYDGSVQDKNASEGSILGTADVVTCLAPLHISSAATRSIYFNECTKKAFDMAYGTTIGEECGVDACLETCVPGVSMIYRFTPGKTSSQRLLCFVGN